MSDFPRSRRHWWRGVPLGGRLQRAIRFCLLNPNDEATTHQIASYCRPEAILRGHKLPEWQIHEHAHALRSIGARRIRREGSQWVWQLPDTPGATPREKR